MREKVVQRGSFKRRSLWAIRMVLGGALFGLAACFVFVCLKPWLQTTIHPDEETTEEAIVLPGEQETEGVSEEQETTDAVETLPPTTQDSAPIEQWIKDALANHMWTIEDYQRLDQLMTSLISELNRGVLSLRTAVSDGAGGWAYSEQAVPGVLWMMTDKEGLILADYSQMGGATTFLVERTGELTALGTLKQADVLTGVAVIRVPRADLEAMGVFAADVLELGLSYSASVGQTAVMVGSPYGSMYSAMTGQIVHTQNGWRDVDAERRILYSDVDAQGSGFLVNLKGQVLGMTTTRISEIVPEEYTGFLAISDLRATIEHLANGRGIAYAGIRGETVTKALAEQQGIPLGLYVTEVIQDGPAYASGIQSGDVIVAVGEAPITNMKDLQNVLSLAAPGQELRVKVMRMGKDAYAEQIYIVVAGAR